MESEKSSRRYRDDRQKERDSSKAHRDRNLIERERDHRHGKSNEIRSSSRDHSVERSLLKRKERDVGEERSDDGEKQRKEVKREKHLCGYMLEDTKYKGETSAAVETRNLSLEAIIKAKEVLRKHKEKLSASAVGSTLPGVLAPHNIEAIKRARELVANMDFYRSSESTPILKVFPAMQISTDAALQQIPSKAPVLRLDKYGKAVDEHGNVINLSKPTNLSTLKVNINKQTKDGFQILKPVLDVGADTNPHFDERMGINKVKILRPKRASFEFVGEGQWSKQAEITKFKSQFGDARAKELRAKQAWLSKSKFNLDINPNLIEVAERVITKEKPKDTVPEVEWWDIPLLKYGKYGELTDNKIDEKNINWEKITIYVEHPQPIEPPAEPAPPPPQPMKLTKKEQKKMRTQSRLAKENDRQEMIRQGLTEPPKPKVRLSNLMRVLGSEVTQDPTRMEMEVRAAAAEREQAHDDRNIARKLTPGEKKEKAERKLFEDKNNLETIVSVYKINDLSHPQKRFKVDVNAQENKLTGCAVIGENMSVVVVEGGGKAIKRYAKLMTRRIDWAAAVAEEEGKEEDIDRPSNKCVLLWQGSVAKPSFHKFLVHQGLTEGAAKKVFSDAGVAHYWDLAVNFIDDQLE